jgi:hypothetical protein
VDASAISETTAPGEGGSTGAASDPAKINAAADEAIAAADAALANASAAIGATGTEGAGAASVMTTPAPSPALLASICKAGIAETFGHSPSIMKVLSNEGGIVRIRYNRPDDGKRWTNDCRVEGNRIIWRTVDAFPGDGPGIWRTRPSDEILTFEIKGKRIVLNTEYPG